MFKKLKTDVIVPENKSRLAYTIWALLLGCLGVHNFYAGNSEKAKAAALDF